jgi:hypothetical protein
MSLEEHESIPPILQALREVMDLQDAPPADHRFTPGQRVRINDDQGIDLGLRGQEGTVLGYRMDACNIAGVPTIGELVAVEIDGAKGNYVFIEDQLQGQ